MRVKDPSFFADKPGSGIEFLEKSFMPVGNTWSVFVLVCVSVCVGREQLSKGKRKELELVKFLRGCSLRSCLLPFIVPSLRLHPFFPPFRQKKFYSSASKNTFLREFKRGSVLKER